MDKKNGNIRFAALIAAVFLILVMPALAEEAGGINAEQAMREHVIMRKIIGCFRSVKGAENYQYIASLLATARLQGKNGFAELEKVLRQELCLS